MTLLKTLAIIILCLYAVCVLLLFLFQSRLIFFPGKLAKNFTFTLRPIDEEVFIKTKDEELINALFYKGSRSDVILYFHGNAGDLSGWQYVAEDFVNVGFSVLIIDYRGYGKSSGRISEKGFYKDARAAVNYLLNQKNYTLKDILIYGRSIGTGIAVELATAYHVKGLILEAPYTSLKKLANEKLPFFFPGLFLRSHFNNLERINRVKCPVIFIHGERDTLIPPHHSRKLFDTFTGRKRLILIPGASHNDVTTYPDYQSFVQLVLPTYF
jgi:uncharacterized protein